MQAERAIFVLCEDTETPADNRQAVSMFCMEARLFQTGACML